MNDDRFKILFDNSSDAHLIVDDQGIVDCNQATIKLLNCTTKDEVLAIHPRELSPEYQPDGRKSIEKSKEMDAIAFKEGMNRFEWVHQKKTGEIFPVDVTLNSVEIDGKPMIVCVWHDLTQRKALEDSIRLMSKDLTVRNETLKQINQRMTSELDQAARFQQSLLPKDFVECPKINAAWHYKPCLELAGDIFNVFRVGEKKVACYVLDVTGHGVASSLLSFTASHFLAPLSDASVISDAYQAGGEIAAPSLIAQRLNSHFSRSTFEGNFFTMVYAEIDLETLVMTYVSAGHPGPIIISKSGESRHIKTNGFPIGILPGLDYENHDIQLKAGDTVFLFSDGVYEARNPSGEEYGLHRLTETLVAGNALDLNDSLINLMDRLESYAQKDDYADDISILGIQIKT